MPNPRHTNWFFTLNNWEEEDPQRILDAVEQGIAKYVLFGKEFAPTTGTPHLQGMIIFRNKVRRGHVQETLKPGVQMHVSIVKSLEGSIVYNKKDGDWYEAGVAPVSQAQKGMKEKERYKRAFDLAELGDMDQLREEHPDIAFRHYTTVKRIRADALHKRKLDHCDPTLRMQWYYGPAGTGKSRKAREENPDAFIKDCNKWWCGYVDQDVIIVEDVDGENKKWMCRLLKIWADIYPFNAEVKNGSTGLIRPKTIIVTSNYHPKDIWEDPRELEPILRRFHVTHFPSLGSVPINPPQPQADPDSEDN